MKKCWKIPENLKKFLKDKERLREKNKTKSVAPALHESDSIVEKIGDSSSGSRIPVLTKLGASVS